MHPRKPSERALLAAGLNLGIDIAGLRETYPKIDEEPFDATTKRMITVHRAPDGRRRVCLKGAPSVVMGMCSHYASAPEQAAELDDDSRAIILGRNEVMSSSALRVLAPAEKIVPESNALDLESGYTFLGLVGMIDPPRAEAVESIAQAYGAGIRVVMLTGDQINTARAIARELKIQDRGRLEAMHARELQNADGARLASMAREVQVFARVSPDIMKQPPRSPGESMLSREFFLLIGWQGVVLALITLVLYGWALEVYGPGDHARIIALFSLISAQIGHLFNCRSRTRSAFRGIFRNPFLWLSIMVVMVLQLLAIYLKPLAEVLRTARINMADLWVIVVSFVAPIVVVEIVKAVWRRRN